MRLNLFRKHLARELDQLPDFRMQKIQSYVLTTAVLARRIDERLGGRLKSEQVQPRQGGQLDFRQLLGMLIHYCRFEPDIYSTTLSDAEVSPEDFYFRVYSEQIKNKRYAGDLLAIKLADYFEVIQKIARDDVFVIRHLLAATVTRLKRAANDPGSVNPDELSEIVASFDDAVCLSRECASTSGLHLRDVPLLVSCLIKSLIYYVHLLSNGRPVIGEFCHGTTSNGNSIER